jgi:hypothetical protein
MIVGIVREILSFDPTTLEGEFQAIEPKEIGAISPYKAQREIIRKKLLKDGLQTKMAKVVTGRLVSTSWGIQGHKVGVAFTSLCANTKGTHLLDFDLLQTRMLYVSKICGQSTSKLLLATSWASVRRLTKVLRQTILLVIAHTSP